MGWSHCERAEIADNLACPACGLTKEAWTLTVNATRTFVVSSKSRPKREKSAWIELELEGGAGASVELELPDGQVTKAVLDGAGLLRREKLYPGECRVRFAGRAVDPAQGAPDEDGWTPCETGRRHAFRWREGAIKVSKPARTHVQWVNLAPDASDLARGNLLKITLAGQGQAFARLERGALNSARSDPRPGLVGAASDAISLTIAGGEATVEVDVGLAGGDVFTLRVGRTDACADDFVELTNWRKLGLQITTRRGKKLPGMGPLIEGLRDVFIELDPYREPLLLDEGDPTLPPGSWFDASERSTTKTGKRLIAGNHNVNALKQKYDQLKSPAGVHLMLVDESLNVVKEDKGEPTGEPHVVTLEQVITTREASFGANDHRVDPVPRHGESAYLIFNKNLLDGGPSFIGGTWESTTNPANRGAIVATDLKKIRFSRVTLELVRDDWTPSAAEPVRVRLQLYAVRDGTLGEAKFHHVMVVQGDDEPELEFWNSTVLHELGHVLHQAGIDVAPGLDAKDHDRRYTGHGHVGRHCGVGLPDAEWAGASYYGLVGTCIMFGEITNPRNMRFCEKCRPFILAVACQPSVNAFGRPVRPVGWVEPGSD